MQLFSVHILSGWVDSIFLKAGTSHPKYFAQSKTLNRWFNSLKLSFFFFFFCILLLLCFHVRDFNICELKAYYLRTDFPWPPSNLRRHGQGRQGVQDFKILCFVWRFSIVSKRAQGYAAVLRGWHGNNQHLIRHTMPLNSLTEMAGSSEKSEWWFPLYFCRVAWK